MGKKFEDKDFLNTGRQAKNKKFQKSQPEEQKESRTEWNHYGMREGTSKNLNQTANLLSRGKSEISWRRIKENKIKDFWMKEILHTFPQEPLKEAIPMKNQT